MLSTYSFRHFARTRHMGTPDNVAAPEREFYDLRQKIPLAQWSHPVNFGLRPGVISGPARRERRRAASMRLNLGAYSTVVHGYTHCHRSAIRCGLYGDQSCEAGPRTHNRDPLNRE